MKRIVSLSVVVALALATGTANAAVISTLFSTGVDSTGTPLADGTIGDPHYTLTSVPGGTNDIRVRRAAGGFPIGPYNADTPFSAWIGPNNSSSLDGPVGSYVYQTTFDLTGLDAATASISGQWATDNNAIDIKINGISTGQTTGFGDFGSFTSFGINSGFVAGVNTLEFIVHNGGGPTALRVEIESATADEQAEVPEPATLTIWGLGALGCAAVAYRRRKRAA